MYELLVVVDKKARAFVKMTETWQIRQPALPRAFPRPSHAFRVKYDQNYGLSVQLVYPSRECTPPYEFTDIKSLPASPGRRRIGSSLYLGLEVLIQKNHKIIGMAFLHI
jgi:hypothetical protein